MTGSTPWADAKEIEIWMQEALALAQLAADQGEVPVGAIVLDESNTVIGKGWNQREALSDPTGHAEIAAIRQAANTRGSWRLDGCKLVVTLEPCPMCAGALLNARITHVVYGARDPKAGAVTTLYAMLEDPRLNHRAQVTDGILADECASILTTFFQALRASGKE